MIEHTDFFLSLVQALYAHYLISSMVKITRSLFHRERGRVRELRDLVSITQLSKTDSWDPNLKFVLPASLPSYLEPLGGILPLS